MSLNRYLLIAIVLLCSSVAVGCQNHTSRQVAIPKLAEADEDRGARLIQSYGCGSCHTVPGVSNATGAVGPPLTQFASRVYVAGMVRNTPDNLMDWLRDPQRIVPGNAMPNLGVSVRDARDMAAYLYSLD